jgi:hypothetical protein
MAILAEGDAQKRDDLIYLNPLPLFTADGTPIEGLFWEVDVFHGDNEGLILAEIEIPCEEAQFEIPDWIGVEVSHDRRYRNNALAKHPYKDWTEEEKYLERIS